jgi:hypothetical protein
MLFPFAISRTTLVSEDGLQVKPHTAAVNQRLKPKGDPIRLAIATTPEPAWVMPHAEIRIQNDPIHAIVAAAQTDPDREYSVRPSGRAHYKLATSISTARKGPLFRSSVCENA